MRCGNLKNSLNDCLLSITIDYTEDPTVSRLLRVPAAFSFQELHAAIQVAFGWASCRNWSFDLRKIGEDGYPVLGHYTRISTRPQQWAQQTRIKQLSSATTKLCDVFEDEEAMLESDLTYMYDFGES